jgi:hypothetical protein
MRIVHPYGTIHTVVTELPEGAFVITTDGLVVYEFRNLVRTPGGTTVECKISGIAPAAGLPDDYVAGVIHYNYIKGLHAPQINFITFAFGGDGMGGPRTLIAWELPFDVVRMAFDNYQLTILME